MQSIYEPNESCRHKYRNEIAKTSSELVNFCSTHLGISKIIKYLRYAHKNTWNSWAIRLESPWTCCWKAAGFTADPSGLRPRPLEDELHGQMLKLESMFLERKHEYRILILYELLKYLLHLVPIGGRQKVKLLCRKV